jgi:GntR family transcriptional regulator
LLIHLDLQSDIPIYSQLVNQIVQGIANGSLQPGEALPSVRSLASDLGINLHTVNKSYTLLKQDGFIQVHRQKGVVVQPDGMPGVTPDYLTKLDNQLTPLVAEAICRGMSEEEFLDLIQSKYKQVKST